MTKKKISYITPKDIMDRMKRHLDRLNTLDAQYLTDYPRKMSESEYKERRHKLKNKFMKLKKEADMLMRGY